MRYMKWIVAFGLLGSLGACNQNNGYPSTASAHNDRNWNSAHRDYDRDGIPNRYDRDANGDGVRDRYQGR